MKIIARYALSVLAVALAAAGMPRPAASQTGPPFCGTRDGIAELLRRDYGEVLRFRATEEGGRIIEFYVAPSGTWTMLVTHGAIGCVGASGTAWTQVDGKTAARPEWQM